MHQRLHDSYLLVFRQTGTDQVFPNFHAFVGACQEIHYTGNKLMIEACRINPDIAGIGIHALNDGNWVLGAGLIDNFRNPKSPITQLRKCSLIVTLLFAQAIKMSTLEGQYKSCLHLSTMETYCQEHFYFV